MKKPRYKDKAVASVCQVFYRQYMLSPAAFFSKKCYRTQNYIHYNQKLLKLTQKRSLQEIFRIGNTYSVSTIFRCCSKNMMRSFSPLFEIRVDVRIKDCNHFFIR